MRTSRFGKSLATLTAATAVALGASLITAPTASAVGGSACTKNVKNHNMMVINVGATAYSGPGTSYSKRKRLEWFDNVYVRCYTVKRGTQWYYGDLPRTSKRGWVNATLLQEI
ncbi:MULTISPECIES: hypothetical protein [Streptomyces]|uniref:hypothetical protein n=1 Tax=Streptomyces TaxID=1883 RepID=UPI00123889C3|nr:MULTISPECIES: hypothetical protein [Streptomyces]NEA03785.1 hypothetical protein [Streptomyces sp. SID10116]MYY80407.1 hypothetical protein [Streptomyces sp. SID335]MYZ15207.1 hypothetical protein [Streptomyces sp. SID337]NDZ88834.1 hypothetical protein [Streptomyces sp. SID10115]NEB44533.1 hypothetical protein [Streptomyces sp. SID339]